ncbi:MAG: hypothetical protein ABI462_04250 [Ignavibacteria bacterium]
MNLFIKTVLLLVILLVISFKIMVSVEDKAIASLNKNSWENLQKDYTYTKQVANNLHKTLSNQ